LAVTAERWEVVPWFAIFGSGDEGGGCNTRGFGPYVGWRGKRDEGIDINFVLTNLRRFVFHIAFCPPLHQDLFHIP
jgi:hypothetical protein